ncbi:hypothetical protein [Paenibacillus glycanilyticus]|uniref:hypothetical protein n=1 Tax=Paenibacillus glycanilyticus TaxID=126569 RepID=UPI0019104BA2|nr:hypothetical protein [Paenibacillus glycanilyticus]
MTVMNVNLATSLSKEYDSIDVGSLSKGGVTQALENATSSTISGEINCSGYNALLVQVYNITGSWEIQIQGSLSSGSYYTPLLGSKSSLLAESIMYLLKGIPDYVKLEAINQTVGAVSVKVQPLNV